MALPGSAARSCGAAASMTESPIAVTSRPGRRTEAEYRGGCECECGTEPECDADAECDAGAERGREPACRTEAALILAPAAICCCSVCPAGENRTPYPAVPTTVTAARGIRAGSARCG